MGHTARAFWLRSPGEGEIRAVELVAVALALLDGAFGRWVHLLWRAERAPADG